MSYKWAIQFIRTELTHHELSNSPGVQGQVLWSIFCRFFMCLMLDGTVKSSLVVMNYSIILITGVLMYLKFLRSVAILLRLCVFCFPVWSLSSNNQPWFILRLQWVLYVFIVLVTSENWRWFNWDRVFLYRGFLSEEECDQLISWVNPCFLSSLTIMLALQLV